MLNTAHNNFRRCTVRLLSIMLHVMSRARLHKAILISIILEWRFYANIPISKGYTGALSASLTIDRLPGVERITQDIILPQLFKEWICYLADKFLLSS